MIHHPLDVGQTPLSHRVRYRADFPESGCGKVDRKGSGTQAFRNRFIRPGSVEHDRPAVGIELSGKARVTGRQESSSILDMPTATAWQMNQAGWATWQKLKRPAMTTQDGPEGMDRDLPRPTGRGNDGRISGMDQGQAQAPSSTRWQRGIRRTRGSGFLRGTAVTRNQATVQGLGG